MATEGICGVVRFDGAPLAPDVIGRMARAAPHRGDVRTHVTPQAHLAHLRVAVMPGALLPLTDRHLTVTASARIDNRDELAPHLRDHLQSAPSSDGQLILGTHLKWGAEGPARLIGDYAYALYDRRSRVLFAARDPMGMRPLYYHHTPERIAFASEIQQLLALDDVPCELHEPAVARHLIADFSALDETCYRGIASLPAGHALQASVQGLRTWRFWDVDPGREERFAHEQDYAERFRELFLRAVHDRMRGSGPIGILLSGGVDSTAAASAIGWWREHETDPVPVHAFSWAFGELRQCDERHLSGLVVARYGFVAHDVPAEANAPLARFPDHGPHRDEPFVGEFQPLIETALAGAKALGITHAWSGTRGDLIASPYAPSYLALLRHRRWRRLAVTLREHAAVSGERLPLVIARHLALPGARGLARRLRGRAPAAAPPALGPPSWLREDWFERVGVDPYEPQEFTAPPDGLIRDRAERYRLVFVPLQMRGVLWSERTRAQFGLSFIDAFSDRRLAEYVVAVPQAVLNRPPGPPKRIVRAALHGVVPDELQRKATKTVPTPLFHDALRRRSSAAVAALLSNMVVERRGFVDAARLRREYQAYAAGGALHPGFWFTLSLEMWLRRHWPG